MPQMKPLLWMNLYLYVLILFLLSMILLNYLFSLYKIENMNKIEKSKINFKWLW
nr:ATP synthase F0 subunit 8 [Ceratosolen fusciceps]